MRPILLVVAFFAFLTACADNRLDKTDPILDLGRDDYRDLHRERPDADAPPIPRIQLKLGDDKPRYVNNKIVSLSVSEKVPLKDVLQELARKADVNLELDPRITGGVIFTARRQTFSRVLDRLCDMAGLRYSVENDFLRIELDEPYLKTYPLDYITQVRKAQGEIGIATNVFASITNKNGQTSANNDSVNGNNSTTKVQNEALADFWAELQANVESILTNTKAHASLRAVDEDTKVQLKEQGLSSVKPYALNKQAGLLTVFGTQRQQEAIEKYINRVKRSTSAQVLIESRIIEVELTESYKGGINWRSLSGSAFNAAARFGTAATGAPFATAATATDGVITLSLNDNDFAGIINFVRSFGATRTLSSPRLTVLNNQPAVLKVARNEVYFTSTIESTPIIGTNGGSPVAVQRTVNSTPNTVPVGFLMTVQPAIDLEKNTVTLNMRPTVSFIVDRVEDPGVKIAAADANVTGVSSSIPVVAVREMDSVLTIPSGTVAVMGGLMQDSAGNLENGVPFVDETPIVGNLGKSRSDNAKMSELVILLRATIVDNGPKPDEADAELYKKYSRDRRPLPVTYHQPAKQEPEAIIGSQENGDDVTSDSDGADVMDENTPEANDTGTNAGKKAASLPHKSVKKKRHHAPAKKTHRKKHKKKRRHS